jgi:hypothetical protein
LIVIHITTHRSLLSRFAVRKQSALRYTCHVFYSFSDLQTARSAIQPAVSGRFADSPDASSPQQMIRIISRSNSRILDLKTKCKSNEIV